VKSQKVKKIIRHLNLIEDAIKILKEEIYAEIEDEDHRGDSSGNNKTGKEKE